MTIDNYSTSIVINLVTTSFHIHNVIMEKFPVSCFLLHEKKLMKSYWIAEDFIFCKRVISSSL
jgi:hypothetical protein